MRTALVGAIAALGMCALVAFATHKVTGLINERNELRLEIAVQTNRIADLEALVDLNEAVLTDRFASSAAIKANATNVQQAIRKRIPAAVSLPPDWRVLHDAAASNSGVPEAPSGADDTPVTAQEAALGVSENYAICLDNADRLEKLQRWVNGVTTDARN